MSVLIDTSAWIEALRKDGDPTIQAQVRHLLQAGQAVTCSMIMLELWNGARGDFEKSQLQRMQDSIAFLDIDNTIWMRSWDLATTCRAHGLTIPSTDLLIIAVAVENDVETLHVDRHFSAYFDLAEKI